MANSCTGVVSLKFIACKPSKRESQRGRSVNNMKCSVIFTKVIYFFVCDTIFVSLEHKIRRIVFCFPKIIIPLHSLLKKVIGEMAEWSIAAVLKTVEVRASGGSNPSLSANKGVNQIITIFTPFFTPRNECILLIYISQLHYSLS